MTDEGRLLYQEIQAARERAQQASRELNELLNRLRPGDLITFEDRGRVYTGRVAWEVLPAGLQTDIGVVNLKTGKRRRVWLGNVRGIVKG